MKFTFIIFLVFSNIVSKSQEDISLIKLELYGGDVTYLGFSTSGKELPLYFSEKNNKVLCSEEFEMYPDSIYYPVVARVRIFNKSDIFPDNLSLRIDLEYIKTSQGSKKSFMILSSEKEIHNSKILGKDSKDTNKFYIERLNDKADEFYVYNNEETGKYRIGYVSNSILPHSLFVRNLGLTIQEGVRQ